MWWKQKHPPSNSELMKHQLSVLTIIFSVVSTILTIVIVAIGIFSYNSSERIERATNELVNFERGLTKEIDNYKEKIDDKLNDKMTVSLTFETIDMLKSTKILIIQSGD